MRITPNLLAPLALILTLGNAALAQDDATGADTVVATVNGTDITLGHMIMVREGLPEQYRQLPDEVLFTGILDQLVQQTLLAQSGGGDVSKRVRVALENERRGLMAGQAAIDIAAAALTDAAVKDAYEAKYADAEMGREYNAAHILVETEEEAQKLVTELEGGADFATLAKEHSTGPSGPNGGQLGWFDEGAMVPEFEEAVKTLEDGAVSAPVKTDFGWHVIILNESRLKEAPALDEVRPQIEAELQQKAVEARIGDLTAEATIERAEEGAIDPKLLREIDLLED